MLHLGFAIAAVVCFWLAWNLQPAKQRGTWYWLVPCLLFAGIVLAVLAGVGLPPWHVTPGTPMCGTC